jgi:glycosyltransferase involved in cell wall biosynthesis
VKTLYVAYFGAQKHLSQSQVLPYLRELAEAGLDVTLLTFEERPADSRDEPERVAALRERLRAAGIDWRWRRYHKRPSLPATAYDVMAGTLFAGYLVWRKGIHVVHARSHVPGLMALILRAVLGVKIVFDLRGLMAEEYVEAGVWREGSLAHRATKRVEGALFRESDAIVALTHRVVQLLDETSLDFRQRKARVEVIPCCVDLARYRPTDGERVRRELGLADRRIMVYAGSLGGWYLTDEIARLFAMGRSRMPDLHLLVLTQSPHILMRRALEAAAAPPESHTIRTVAPEEMPAHLSSGDLGVHLIRPGFSMVANSPTKFGEYLACGLPILTNAGIGDCDELIRGERVGTLVESLDPEGYRRAWQEMEQLLQDGDRAARCREVAQRRFSLRTVGREGYLRVYRGLGFEARSSSGRP